MNLTCRILTIGVAVTVARVSGQTEVPDSPKKEARVTQIIKDVKILGFKSPARPAVVNDEVRENTAVRTGDESRSELTFEDLTITRLGANTIFSFNKAGRGGTLGSGAVLLRVPKDSGGAEFRTNAVTVGITGTTIIFESTREGRDKLTVLEGSARLGLTKHPEEFSDIVAGQMLDVKKEANKIPPPKDVDLERLMKTNPLITDFPPLPSQDLILAAINTQQSSSGSTKPKRTPRPSRSPTPEPETSYTPIPTFTPRYTPIYTPPPRPNSTPRIDIYTPPPKPTKPPKGNSIYTPPPKPWPSPKTIPIATPTPQATLPPGKLNLPKKIIRRPLRATPTPTPGPRIN
jgi:FecR protein